MHFAVFPDRLHQSQYLAFLLCVVPLLGLSRFGLCWPVDSPWLVEPVAVRLQRWYPTSFFREPSGARFASPRACYLAVRIIRPEVGEDKGVRCISSGTTHRDPVGQSHATPAWTGSAGVFRECAGVRVASPRACYLAVRALYPGMVRAYLHSLWERVSTRGPGGQSRGDPKEGSVLGVFPRSRGSRVASPRA